jgi:predicted nucleotidyltransferase
MLSQKQLRVLGFFSSNLFAEYSFSDLKKHLNESSHSFLQNTLKFFVEQKLLHFRIIGSSKLYRLNLSSSLLSSHIPIYAFSVLPLEARLSLDLLLKELSSSPFVSVIIFGSYANQSQTSSSDLDILILTPSSAQKKSVRIALNHAKTTSLIPIDSNIFTFSEFKKLLLAPYDNLAKQILSKNLPVFSPIPFYSSILPLVNNDFKYFSKTCTK